MGLLGFCLACFILAFLLGERVAGDVITIFGSEGNCTIDTSRIAFTKVIDCSFLGLTYENLAALNVSFSSFVFSPVTIDFSHNALTAIPPGLLDNILSGFVILDVSHNNLTTGNLSALSTSGITSLKISHNQISELNLNRSLKLTYLDASYCGIKTLGGSFFSNRGSTGLFLNVYIDLQGNEIESFPPADASIPLFNYFNMRDNRLTQVPGFTQFHTPDFLDLSENMITSISSSFNISSRGSSFIINLSHNNITHIAESAFDITIGAMRYVNLDLDLSYNAITSWTPKRLPSSIGILNLSHNTLTRLTEDLFLNVSNVRILDVSFNQITKIPSNLPLVGQFLASDNNITHIPAKLADVFRAMSIISLFNNPSQCFRTLHIETSTSVVRCFCAEGYFGSEFCEPIDTYDILPSIFSRLAPIPVTLFDGTSFELRPGILSQRPSNLSFQIPAKEGGFISFTALGVNSVFATVNQSIDDQSLAPLPPLNLVFNTSIRESLPEHSFEPLVNPLVPSRLIYSLSVGSSLPKGLRVDPDVPSFFGVPQEASSRLVVSVLAQDLSSREAKLAAIIEFNIQDCGNFSCMNNGSCHDDNDPYNNVFSCSCPPRYRGQFCEIFDNTPPIIIACSKNVVLLATNSDVLGGQISNLNVFNSYQLLDVDPQGSVYYTLIGNNSRQLLSTGAMVPFGRHQIELEIVDEAQNSARCYFFITTLQLLSNLSTDSGHVITGFQGTSIKVGIFTSFLSVSSLLTMDIIGGQLPSGVSFDSSSGEIVGIPLVATSNKVPASVEFQVCDVGLVQLELAEKLDYCSLFNLTFLISPFSITSSVLAQDPVLSPVLNVPFQWKIPDMQVVGGSNCFTFQNVSGVLPRGLIFHADGAISGTALEFGANFHFQIQALDATGLTTLVNNGSQLSIFVSDCDDALTCVHGACIDNILHDGVFDCNCTNPLYKKANSNACSVQDVTPPTIAHCPPSIVRFVGQSVPLSSGEFLFPPPDISVDDVRDDSGALPSLKFFQNGTQMFFPTSLPFGLYDIQLMATDLANNSAICTFHVSVLPLVASSQSVENTFSGYVGSTFAAPLFNMSWPSLQTLPVSVVVLPIFLPQGLSFDLLAGSVVGVPLEPCGSKDFNITLCDLRTSSPLCASLGFKIAIAPFTISWPSYSMILSNAALGLPYQSLSPGSVKITGGSNFVIYELAGNDSLPDGLALNTLGTVWGTPTVSGADFRFRIQATDSSLVSTLVNNGSYFSLSVRDCDDHLTCVHGFCVDPDPFDGLFDCNCTDPSYLKGPDGRCDRPRDVQDTLPPTILQCAQSVIRVMSPLESNVNIFLDELSTYSVIDDSQSAPFVFFQLKNSAQNITFPFLAPVGETEITLVAADQRNNRATCSLFITIFHLAAPLLKLQQLTLSQGTPTILPFVSLNSPGIPFLRPPAISIFGHGDLPFGLTIDNAQGRLIGTPLVSSVNGSSLNLRICDPALVNPLQMTCDFVPLFFIITEYAVRWTPKPLSPLEGLNFGGAVLNRSYSSGSITSLFNVSFVGGSSCVNYAPVGTSGFVPGLSMDSSGLITGKPMASGKYSFQIQATDASAVTTLVNSGKLFTLVVNDCDNETSCGFGVCIDDVPFDGLFSCKCTNPRYAISISGKCDTLIPESIKIVKCVPNVVTILGTSEKTRRFASPSSFSDFEVENAAGNSSYSTRFLLQNSLVTFPLDLPFGVNTLLLVITPINPAVGVSVNCSFDVSVLQTTAIILRSFGPITIPLSLDQGTPISQSIALLPNKTSGPIFFTFTPLEPNRLPLGTFIDPSKGLLLGTPYEMASSLLSVLQVCDSRNPGMLCDILQLKFKILSFAVSWTPLGTSRRATAPSRVVLPPAVLNHPYFFDPSTSNMTIQITGGTHCVSYLPVPSNALPSGLVMGTTGIISGTPTTSKNASFSILAKDAVGVDSQVNGQSQFILIVQDCDNQLSCGFGSCIDSTPFDQIFSCNCSESYVIDVNSNKCISSAASASSTSSTSVKVIGIATGVGFFFILLIIAILVFVFYKRAIKEKPYDFSKLTPKLNAANGPPAIPRELTRARLKMIERIGRGQFGNVCRAIYFDSHCSSEDIVAVKMVASDETSARSELLEEALTMAQFNHPNILKLIGVISIGSPLLIVIEYMGLGSLHSYLKIGGAMDTTTRLNIARQIALGLNYLASRRYVHRDVAARNVLLDADMKPKIADFGLSRDTSIEDSNYYRSSGGMIPVRWCAPEALETKKYSEATDVWAYGILLYEMYTKSEIPYKDWDNQRVWTEVCAGYRLPIPPGCPPDLYDLMMLCWDAEPTQRPTFDDIQASLPNVRPPTSVYVDFGLNEDHFIPPLHTPTKVPEENPFLGISLPRSSNDSSHPPTLAYEDRHPGSKSQSPQQSSSPVSSRRGSRPMLVNPIYAPNEDELLSYDPCFRLPNSLPMVSSPSTSSSPSSSTSNTNRGEYLEIVSNGGPLHEARRGQKATKETHI